MRLIFSTLTILTTIFVVSGCSIQSNKPDYQYPANSNASGGDWPELAVTSELEAAGQSVSTQAQDNQVEADRLAARARALKARAERLRRQIGN